MKDKEASLILLSLLEKYSLTKREKEAVLTAIGVLGWTSLVEGKINSLKEKRKRDLN